MSEPTLYQATVKPAYIGYRGDERPLVLQEAIDMGALVPVEPDEVAARIANDLLSQVGDQALGFIDCDRLAAAALGIGGDDE